MDERDDCGEYGSGCVTEKELMKDNFDIGGARMAQHWCLAFGHMFGSLKGLSVGRS